MSGNIDRVGARLSEGGSMSRLEWTALKQLLGHGRSNIVHLASSKFSWCNIRNAQEHSQHRPGFQAVKTIWPCRRFSGFGQCFCYAAARLEGESYFSLYDWICLEVAVRIWGRRKDGFIFSFFFADVHVPSSGCSCSWLCKDPSSLDMLDLPSARCALIPGEGILDGHSQ